MKIDYEYTFGLPIGIVWKMIKDTSILRNSIPGCKSFVENKNGEYLAVIDINFGPIKDVFTLEIWRVQEKSPAFYRLHFKGKGNLGEIEGIGDLSFKEVQGSTRLTITADAKVAGALAVTAQKKLDGGSTKGLENFLQKIEREIKRSLYRTRRGR
ncbi:SRPBCC domain-containing protein [Neobacillus sp. FSL H8-0543]|uniref:CoxG family protein n=1 Tax=Neobacillus sp. FSL H8-0543 TaxID=2954672 RepID=UPI0031588931